MALNEEMILSGKFVFISYSHRDEEIVKEDMEKLLSLGVRVWYDVNMRVGKDWTEIASRVLHHPNCAGVIFYNSPHAFVSSAVQREQEITRELGLEYWSVNLDGKSTPEISFGAMNLLSQRYGPADPAFAAYMQENYPKQISMFNPNIICYMRADSKALVDRIYSELAVSYGLVDNEDNFITELQKKEMASRDKGEIILGRYICSEYIGPEQAKTNDDSRFGEEKNLIQLNGKRYNTKELGWKLMYVENGIAVLLCTRILTQSSFFQGQAFLDLAFPQITFLDEEREKTGFIRARYMTLADVEKCKNVNNESSLLLGENSALKHWWIDEKGLALNWKQTYSDATQYEKGFSCLIKKGIRPVIEISARDLH